jgi:chaperone required for assembly of F1-ATPase
LKRFYDRAGVEPAAGGFRVVLDGRPVRTAMGQPQIVPRRGLAQLLADEWNVQGRQIGAGDLPLRDLADFAIDVVMPQRGATIQAILRFGETDTLCYRADPDEPLHARQLRVWEPVLRGIESRHGIVLERVSGVLHRRQRQSTLDVFRGLLDNHDAYTLSALRSLASLAASLVVALAALDGTADAEALWHAANLEEDWQAEHWGWDRNAEQRRAQKLGEFTRAMQFARQALTG